VDEFEQQRLDDPDALAACLGAMQADLLRVGFQLGDAVKRLLAGRPLSAENLQDIEPSLNIYLRVARQNERYGQLDLRRAEQQASASHGPAMERELTQSEGPLRQVPK
jgi:hypothetical protein